jgi:hypothetical protein
LAFVVKWAAVAPPPNDLTQQLLRRIRVPQRGQGGLMLGLGLQFYQPLKVSDAALQRLDLAMQHADLLGNCIFESIDHFALLNFSTLSPSSCARKQSTRLLAAVQAHARGAVQDDDITMVLIRRLASG